MLIVTAFTNAFLDGLRAVDTEIANPLTINKFSITNDYIKGYESILIQSLEVKA